MGLKSRMDDKHKKMKRPLTINQKAMRKLYWLPQTESDLRLNKKLIS